MIKQIKFIALLLHTLLFIGCLWVPVTKEHAVSEKDLNSIVIGRSTKQDVYKILGKPNRLEHEKYYVSDVEWSYGFLIIISPQGGGAGYLSGKQYRILLEFDENDILRNYDIEKGYVKFSYKSRYGVVSKSASLKTHKTVLLWEKPITGLSHHSSIANSSNKQLLAIKKKHGPVWLINLETSEKVKLKNMKDVRYLNLSPDSRYLAYFSGFIKTLDTDTQRQLSIFKGHEKTSFLAFFPDGNKIASGGRNGFVRIWETITGIEINSFKAYEGSVGSIAVSPDGKMLATAGDKSIILWDARTGNELDRIKDKGNLQYLPCGLKFSPDGTILAINKGSHVELMRINKLWKSFEQLEDVFLLPFAGLYSRSWRLIDFSKDGINIAASNGSAIVWDIERRQKIWRHVVNYKNARHPWFQRPYDPSDIHAIAFSQNKELLVTATSKGVFQIKLQLQD